MNLQQVTRWDGLPATLEQLERKLIGTPYMCQESPDGTVLVWNKQTADHVSRVQQGQYVWLHSNVLFVSTQAPKVYPTFAEWLGRDDRARPTFTREEAFYALKAKGEGLAACIQNPAPKMEMLAALLNELKNLTNLMDDVVESIETWEEK